MSESSPAAGSNRPGTYLLRALPSCAGIFVYITLRLFVVLSAGDLLHATESREAKHTELAWAAATGMLGEPGWGFFDFALTAGNLHHASFTSVSLAYWALSLVLGETLLLVPVDSGARRTRSGAGACRDLRAPSYAIFGGLVFTQLCEPYLKAEWGDDFDARAPLPLLERWQYGLREAATDQVVVLSQVLASALTVAHFATLGR